LDFRENRDWVHAKKEKNGPLLYKVGDLYNYISSCEGKGPIMFNVLIYQDGTVGEETSKVMEELKAKIQNR